MDRPTCEVSYLQGKVLHASVDSFLCIPNFRAFLRSRWRGWPLADCNIDNGGSKSCKWAVLWIFGASCTGEESRRAGWVGGGDAEAILFEGQMQCIEWAFYCYVQILHIYPLGGVMDPNTESRKKKSLFMVTYSCMTASQARIVCQSQQHPSLTCHTIAREK